MNSRLSRLWVASCAKGVATFFAIAGGVVFGISGTHQFWSEVVSAFLFITWMTSLGGQPLAAMALSFFFSGLAMYLQCVVQSNVKYEGNKGVWVSPESAPAHVRTAVWSFVVLALSLVATIALFRFSAPFSESTSLWCGAHFLAVLANCAAAIVGIAMSVTIADVKSQQTEPALQ